jgi:hypothetical protein
MADYQSVSINENTESENISLEEQAAKQDAQNQPTGEAPQTTEETRPEWLPEKFNSPEEMAKAYDSLQSKMSSKSSKGSKTKQQDSTEETNHLDTAIGEATTEFNETGELSDGAFEALAKAGLSREFVEAYVAGQTAIADNQTAQVQELIGGPQNYEAMSEWAIENLSEEQLDAYNEVVESGTVDQAKMAVQGLFSQFTAAGGKTPQVVMGATQGASVKPFNSAAQVTEAMKDSRYKSDPAYRQNVEQRLAVTQVF